LDAELRGAQEKAEKPISVHVELKSLLSRYASAEEGPVFARELPPGSDVAALLDGLQVPRKWLGLVAVNGARVARERILHDGDSVLVYPPFLSGG
jgi:sulfur carrier protein ThiS